jgi:Tfp pilus assembly protein PilN
MSIDNLLLLTSDMTFTTIADISEAITDINTTLAGLTGVTQVELDAVEAIANGAQTTADQGVDDAAVAKTTADTADALATSL